MAVEWKRDMYGTANAGSREESGKQQKNPEQNHNRDARRREAGERKIYVDM